MLILLERSGSSTLAVELRDALAAKETAERRARESRLAAEVLEKKVEEASEGRRKAKGQVAGLRVQLQQAEDQRFKLQGELETVQTEIKELRLEHTHQIQDLNHRIDANAEARLNEFMARIGSDIRKQVIDIPAQGSPVTSELGGVLLIRLHSVLDVLDHGGIRVRQ